MRRFILAAALCAWPVVAQAQEENNLPDPGCRAEKQTVELFGKPEQKLNFMHHICPENVAPPYTFVIRNGDTLMAQWKGPNPGETEVAKFWPLNNERPSVRIKALAESATPAEEKGHCIVQMDYGTARYFWTPDVAYLEDLLKVDEPFSACGTFGDTNDAIQFWKVVGSGVIAYFWLGQDDPFFDPDSFEFINEKDPGKAG
jgi:hypothetical protein